MSGASEFESIAARFHAENVHDAADCLCVIHALGPPKDLFDGLLTQLQPLLVFSGDTNRTLLNLQRFLQASRSPLAWLSLFEREPDALQTLIQLFLTSQYLADVLIADPEAFDLLRITAGQAVEKSVLQDEILAEVDAAADLRSVMRILRDYRHRETLRIAFGEFVAQQPIEIVTTQLSNLAECILQAALVAAHRETAEKHRFARNAEAEQPRVSVIALGRLGGAELSYASDLDLLLVYDSPSSPNGFSGPVDESQAAAYVERVGQLVVRLLSESTRNGFAYRVEMRLRPTGMDRRSAVSVQQAVNYYDSAGRTWERQAFINARPVAGDIVLGQALLSQLEPWIYRRYLMRADITGLAALKRRIECRVQRVSNDPHSLKFALERIGDIESVTQFLQLLHGGESPSVRASGTLEAIRQLLQAGCLTAEEQAILAGGYRFLRRLEHALQITLDRKVRSLPRSDIELTKVARRIGYRDADDAAVTTFRRELGEQMQSTRQVLQQLLHDAFENEAEAAPETDLVLDPKPVPEVISATLAPYGFTDAATAYRHLQELAVESIPFLSTRRCRHFLAAIAPKLLQAISATPDPDATLIALANVSDSLGGKAVLWELFSLNPPSLDLCVRLCAGSSYLTGILTSNPGMIDELMDSLMLDRLPSQEELASSLAELCRGAIDIGPILQSFKNSMHLRVGVRDILGKDTISQTHAALSDIAEVCLEQVIHHEFHRLLHQAGMPMFTNEAGVSEAAELVVLAVGKLGGREPNYHSDLDVIFLFDGEGQTQSLLPNRRFEPTTNRHFFNQLCQRVMQAVTRVGVTGRLYDLDVSLRPLGRSGELAITVDDLRRYFANAGGQLWERQTLCKARPIWGSVRAQAQAMDCVREVLVQTPWDEGCAQQIADRRLHSQKGASLRNLKRGVGGTMDVEFIVQMLQLAHAAAYPQVLVPGTLDALQQLAAAGALASDTAQELGESYEFLRRVESCIRLMNTSARHELPVEERELRQLAFLINPLGSNSPFDTFELTKRCDRARQQCRAAFERVFADYTPSTEG